jgi:hypothetical protein
MGVIKTAAILERYGLSKDAFFVLHRASMSHKDAPRGVQLNGACREGRCDLVPGSDTCRAWTLLLDIIERNLPLDPTSPK